MTLDYDVLIIGAGISGISAAVHLQQRNPHKTFAILEARDAIGGTWDLFRYPGIRSDSDMHTFGFSFKPWKSPKAIADAPSILQYLNETIDEYALKDKIKFGHKMLGADWSSETAHWTVHVETASGMQQITCNFLFTCSGYYSYDSPHNPELPGESDFGGKCLHPQNWDESLDYTDKNVVVIGSGATAVTIVPSMAKTARHVTMLQRTPTYIVARPSRDWFANLARKFLPGMWAYNLTRAKNEWLQNFIYKSAMKKPEKTKTNIFKLTRKSLGLKKTDQLPADYIPPYDPWTQRLCLVPDNDLFDAITDGTASIVTDHIKTLTPTGIALSSGAHVDADIIVKATGINVIVLSNGTFKVDDRPVSFADTFTYEGFMYSGVPNLASTFGYINASWTLRADLISDYVARLIAHMDEIGMQQVTPTPPTHMTPRPWITTFNPGYITRILDDLPKQGDAAPWINAQDYKRDKKVLPNKPLDDGHMVFSNPAKPHARNVQDAAE